MYFPDQNLLKIRDPMGLKFYAFEMQKWEKWRHSFSYVYFQSYGHLNVKNGSFNVLSTQYRKKTDPVWARYLNVLVGPFTKYYGLLSSNLRLANCQHLKIQDFACPLLNQHFFNFFFILIFLPTISHEQLRPRPIKHTIFCKNSMRSSTCT